MSKEKIIVALDVDTVDKAVDLVEILRDEVGAFKVGLELFNNTGPAIFKELRAAGAKKLFYDCKFHDIPNTVAGASHAAAGMNVWMFNVHCSGGSAMMKAAADSAREQAERLGIVKPLIIGVTALTSIDQQMLELELGVGMPMSGYVAQLAVLAKHAGLDGVVASPHEIEIIRHTCGSDFLIVTPGVRPASAEVNDQKRIMTPSEAIKHGADYLVIGRPITAALDPAAAAREIAGEIGFSAD